MLKIFNQSHEAVGYIKKCRDCKIESVLSTAEKTLSFTYLGKAGKIDYEYYIQTFDDEYVVKAIRITSDGYPEYTATLNTEELEAKTWETFIAKDSSLRDTANLALVGTGWRVAECTVDKKRSVGLQNVTSKVVLQKLCTVFMCEMQVDSKAKTVSFREKFGEDKGVYFLQGLNLRQLTLSGDTYDFYTRIIPVGKDNLKITSVNDGKEYIDNFQYSKKIIPYIWQDTSYEDADALMEDASEKLKDLSIPKKSYTADIRDLAYRSAEYSILEYGLGDTITLIDRKTGIRDKQRITQIIEYPGNPDKNTCDIANTRETFDEIQSRLKEAASIVEAAKNLDGSLNGVVDKVTTDQILGFNDAVESGIQNSNTVSGIKSDIQAVTAEIGTIQSTYLKTTEADIKFATIENLNATTATVHDLNADYAKFKTATTDEFAAKTAQIEKVSGDLASFKSGEFEDLKAKKADIDLANVTNAWIQNGIIKDGSIGSAAIHDGAITNVKIADATIEAAKINSINADTITAGTLKTKRLIITGEDGQDSIVKAINMANGIHEAEVNDRKIQAASIDVVDLSAFHAKIAQFEMSANAIYSGKTSIKDPTSGIYISTTGIGIGNGGITGKNESPIQMYADGTFKLIGKNSKLDFNTVTGEMDIEASSFRVASKAVATKDDIDDVKSEVVTTLRIESSEGSSLTAKTGLPVLTVIVYHGRTRIADYDTLMKTMGSEVYLEWSCKKKGESTYTAVSSTDSRISNNGFTFSPLKVDVENHSTFKCRLLSKGDEYIDPDQQTVIDRIESRLTDYVDNMLFPGVKDEFTAVKEGVIKELSSDTYIAQIEKNASDIAELKRGASGSKPLEQGLSLAWLGWSNNIERGNGIENDALMFSKHDIVGMQRLNLNRLADSKPTFTENTLKILKRAKELNPKLRTFEYLQSESGRTDFTYNGDHAHLNFDGSWDESTADLSGCTRIYTYQQICDWLDYFKESGTDGVFFDDWGYDFAKEDICYQMSLSVDDYADKNAALNKKWIMLIEACHDRGMFLITNGGMPFSVGDWYTYLDENDIICLESCLISSLNYTDDYTWQNGQKDIYDYYANWYSNGKCKAKLWSMNYLPGNADSYKELVLTYLCALTLACGGHYVSMGTFRCIEKPDFVQLFSEGDTKSIKKIDDNTYQLKVNNHILEAHKWSSLSGSVSEETANKNYYILDSRKFTNGFLTAPVVDGEMASEIEVISKKLDSVSDDSRKNAISYWRMAIDDWNTSLTFSDYANMILTDPEIHGISGGSLEIVRNSDGTCDIVCSYTELSQGGIYLSVIRPSNYESFEQTGEGLEFGFSDVIFDMSEDSWTLPNGTVYEAKWLWSTPSFYIYTDMTPLDGTGVTDYKIDGVGSDLGMATGHYKKSSRDIFTAYNIRVWFHAPDGQYFNGTVTLKNVYLIDLGEHSDEISKKWYTNIFPESFNNSSAMAAKMTAVEKQGWKMYDFVVSHTNAWGWIKYKYTGDELIALRGHTVEFGCTSMTFSNGQTGMGSSANGWVNYAFGIGVNTDNPNTVRLYADTVNKSEAWGEKLCCLKYTIPDDATSLVIGFQSYGFPTDVTLTVKDVYMYDLGEEVSIRGKSSTNASLRLCRVNEEQEALTPSNMRNALYVTEKGRLYCYDLTGTKTDIAGSVYVGAMEAGYTGSPEEFGNALYNLILNGGSGSVTDASEVASLVKEKLRLESDDEYIYLKYDAEEISKIPFTGTTPDPEPDPTVAIKIAKGASWTMSGTDPKVGGNTTRAFSYKSDTIPSVDMVDSSHAYGIPLENGQKYAIKLDPIIASACYYGLNVYSAAGRVLDSGWKAAGTNYTYTPSSDGLYLYVNFKSGSTGYTTITDEILTKLQNGFSVTKIYDT